MSIDENGYIGKVILIGINFLDKDEQLIEQYQTHGTIKGVNAESKMEIERNDGSIFIFPFDPRYIMRAKEGTYRERSTGAVIENPDFLTSYSLSDTLPENIESYKKYGFTDFVKGDG